MVCASVRPEIFLLPSFACDGHFMDNSFLCPVIFVPKRINLPSIISSQSCYRTLKLTPITNNHQSKLNFPYRANLNLIYIAIFSIILKSDESYSYTYWWNIKCLFSNTISHTYLLDEQIDYFSFKVNLITRVSQEPCYKHIFE